MKILVKYDYINKNGNIDLSKPPISTVVEVSDEQCEVMIEVDYQNRIALATDKSSVKKRSIQEIFDEDFNRPYYNDWHRENRHRGNVPKPYRGDDEPSDSSDGLEYIPDYSQTEERERKNEYEVVCQHLREILKPEYADVLIAVVLDGLTPEEYAHGKKLKRDTVYKRLQRAKEKYRTLK